MKRIKIIGIVLIGILLAGVYSYRTWSIPIYDTNIDAATYENVGELKESTKVEQSFLCEHNGLRAVKIAISNLEFSSDVEYHWQLREVDSRNIVAEGRLKSKDINNSEKTMFSFDIQKDSKNREYSFVLEAGGRDIEHGITVMKTKPAKGQKENIVVNGVPEERSMVLNQEIRYLNIETGIVFAGIYLYLIFFMRFLLKIFK